MRYTIMLHILWTNPFVHIRQHSIFFGRGFFLLICQKENFYRLKKFQASESRCVRENLTKTIPTKNVSIKCDQLFVLETMVRVQCEWPPWKSIQFCSLFLCVKITSLQKHVIFLVYILNTHQTHNCRTFRGKILLFVEVINIRSIIFRVNDFFLFLYLVRYRFAFCFLCMICHTPTTNSYS